MILHTSLSIRQFFLFFLFFLFFFQFSHVTPKVAISQKRFSQIWLSRNPITYMLVKPLEPISFSVALSLSLTHTTKSKTFLDC
jgi:hypothetical protein